MLQRKWIEVSGFHCGRQESSVYGLSSNRIIPDMGSPSSRRAALFPITQVLFVSTATLVSGCLPQDCENWMCTDWESAEGTAFALSFWG